MTANQTWYLVEYAIQSLPELRSPDLHQPTPSYAYYTKTREVDENEVMCFRPVAARQPFSHRAPILLHSIHMLIHDKSQ